MQQTHMTMAEFAQRYSISKTKAEELRRMKGFPKVLKIDHLVRLPIDEVDEFMQRFVEVNRYAANGTEA